MSRCVPVGLQATGGSRPHTWKTTCVTISLVLLATALLSLSCGDDGGDGANTGATSTETASPAADSTEELFELTLTAEDTLFDKDLLQAPAASEVSLTLDNRDRAEHTFSLYPSQGSQDPLFRGEPFAGPSFLTYQFPAPETPGTYFFQCDIHPAVMNGQFIVE
jgi:plastocyanin